MVEDKTLLSMTTIIGIVILDSVAIMNGIDGIVLTTSIAAIAGVGGYMFNSLRR